MDADGNIVPTTDHIADGWTVKVDSAGESVTVHVVKRGEVDWRAGPG